MLREAIPLLETRLMPGRAVHPARGFEEARRLLEPVGLRGARIVFVTDGSDDDPSASQAAARALADDGARVSVLAVAGESEPLAALARSGGGALAALTIDDGDLERVLAGSDAADALGGAALVHSDVQTNEWKDMGAWLLWLPVLLAPFAFRRGWAGAALAVLFLQLAPAPARAGVLDAFERPDQRAARAFADGRYAESAQRFEDPAWQAAARYRAGDFAGASEALAKRQDATSQYNLGNALAKSGQLEAAFAAYERALASAPTDADARFNRDLVKQLLEQQSKPPPQSSKDGKGSQDQKQSGAQGQQNENQASQAGEPTQGSDAGKGEKAGDAAAEAEAAKNADAQKAGDEAKAGDAAQADAKAKDEAEANAAAGAREPGASTGKDASGSPAEAPKPEPQNAGAGERHDQASAGELPPESAAAGAPIAGDPGDAARQSGSAAASNARPLSPQEQERAQWMARLPDDPGGLLREKIRRDYQRKQAARNGEEGT